MGALVAVAVVMTGGVVSASPAQAASDTMLCRGFADCVREGRGHAGYAAVYRSSFWNMRPGHNCTNYIGYRLTRGRLVARPAGAVDAGTWGAAARRAGIPVSRSPRVGSIAWWRPGFHGASSGGHVAYVEAVRADGSIVVSEDNLGGTFTWRLLTKKGGSWPSGFIRFPESDGSPAGQLLWARSAGAGALRLSGTANEPDVDAGGRRYLVTVGGPREQAGVESFSFTTPFFRFERLKTLATRGPTTIYLYALNTPGTGGTDRLLGSRTVAIG